MLTEKERLALAGAMASSIGKALGQSYGQRDGAWWLFTAGEPMRPLEADEVAWHVARRHAPFVAGGVEPDDPRWWDEPEASHAD